MDKEHLHIIEDINGKLNRIIESFAALDKKFDVKIDALNEKIEQTTLMLGKMIPDTNSGR